LIRIAQQNTRKQPGFTQNLETVAYAKNIAAVVGEFDHSFHDGRKTRNGTSAYIISIGKSTGQHHTIAWAEAFGQTGFFVPEFNHFAAHDITQNVYHIVVAVGTRKYDYAKFHVESVLQRKLALSME
jgi:hypothetical protein